MIKSFPNYRITSASDQNQNNQKEKEENKDNTPASLADKDPIRYQSVVKFASMCLPDTLGREEKDAIQVSLLAGGTSNQLYHVFCPAKIASTANQNENDDFNDEDHQVAHLYECVVRVFGDAISQVVDREAEGFWQSRFLETFGKCQNGSAFEFLRGYKPVPDHSKKNQIEDHVDEITRQLAHINSLHLVDKQQREELKKFVSSTETRQTRLADAMLSVWIDRAEVALKKVQQTEKKEKGKKFLGEVIESGLLRKAAMSLQAEIEASALHHVTVPFTHNDSNPLNLMVKEEDDDNNNAFPSSVPKENNNNMNHQSDQKSATPMTVAAAAAAPSSPTKHIFERNSMKLIDFEYAGRNYAQFEIGTHWNEWCGLECDYSKFPDEKAQKEFLRKYFKNIRYNMMLEKDDLVCLECARLSRMGTRENSSTNFLSSLSAPAVTAKCFCHIVSNNRTKKDNNNNNNIDITKMVESRSKSSKSFDTTTTEEETSTSTDFCLEYMQHPSQLDAETNFEIFRKLCLLHARVAHIGWTAWSIFQAASSEIEGFDYIDYAEMRWNEYLKNTNKKKES